MTVLYLTEPGTTLAARSRTLVVRSGTVTRARVPVLNVQRVAVLAPAHLTSAAVALCAREQVELVVMARGGRGIVRLGASDAGLELRGAQHRRAEDPAFCLELARAVVRGKVRNQRRLLSRSAEGREPPVAQARAALDGVLAKVEGTATVAALRGLEGHASAHYFRALRALLNPEYGFRVRNRRPPRDSANALLSFAYTLLTAEATAAVAAAGLEPALGFFHRARGGRPALALDLVEEFRAPVADALVLQLTGWRAVSPDDFRPRGGGVRMRGRARRRFLEGYEQKMGKPFTLRGGGETTLREAVRTQAAALAAAIRTGGSYVPFETP